MDVKTLLCEDMTNKMRVALTNPDEDYDIGPSNPAVGSKWECYGTIANCNRYEVEVIWDNGKYNSYKDNELTLVMIGEMEGRCKSIW